MNLAPNYEWDCILSMVYNRIDISVHYGYFMKQWNTDYIQTKLFLVVRIIKLIKISLL